MYFDALTHPTLDGSWYQGEKESSFASLHQQLVDHKMLGACVVGLPGVGAYSHKEFYKTATAYPGFYPVAALTCADIEAASFELEKIRELGFQAIKIHPRMLGIKDIDVFLTGVFRRAHELQLKIFYCTYYFQMRGAMVSRDPYWGLVGALNAFPEVPVLLLHGGGVRLLEYAELCRFSDNLLLDLSFTAIKYNTSSVTADIAFLTRQFDGKICLGSDHPEYAVSDAILFYEKLLEGLSQAKRENIMHRNIMSFLGVLGRLDPNAMNTFDVDVL